MFPDRESVLTLQAAEILVRCVRSGVTGRAHDVHVITPVEVGSPSDERIPSACSMSPSGLGGPNRLDLRVDDTGQYPPLRSNIIRSLPAREHLAEHRRREHLPSSSDRSRAPSTTVAPEIKR